MKHSTWTALLLAGAAVTWVASGHLGQSPQTIAASGASTEPVLMQVRADIYTAEPVSRRLIVHGQTEARRTVTVRAETAGSVVAVSIPRGSRVKAGDVLVRLAEDERHERLAQAEALVRQRELEYRAAQSLKTQRLSAERQVAEARALLEAARAEHKNARLHLERAAIRAPYSGVLEARPVEVGDYLGVGDPAAVVVELDPLRARGEAAEHEVARLRPEMAGRVRLPDGRQFPAKVTYVAATAEPATRTFSVEMEFANPDGRIPAGMTAELQIPTETARGHRLSSGLLTLNDAGELGVKRVDEQGVVEFLPVSLLQADAEAVWVEGLPERVRLITAGQGFVRDGDRVRVVGEPR